MSAIVVGDDSSLQVDSRPNDGWLGLSRRPLGAVL